ncbi:hypothetical protein ACFL0T_06715 [Candidatus Omnitrophota bacterium]
MKEKIELARDEETRGSINQFIVECMFSKYFEEKEEGRQQELAPTEREKVAV